MRIKNYVAEGVGSALLMFIGLSSIALYHDPLGVAFCFGLIYLVLFYSFGNISGCHFNPIVSLSYLINKKLSVLDFFGYVGSQLVGSLIGGFLFKIMLPSENVQIYFSHATELCCNGDAVAAVFVEIILSYIFVLTFLGANSKSRNKSVRGIIIGAAVILVTLASATVNFSAVNPFKALTAAIFSNSWKQIAIFLLCPFVGSILATLHFNWFQKKTEDDNLD